MIVSPDDLADLEGTHSVLSNPKALADIRGAEAAHSAGDVVRGVDAIRSFATVREPEACELVPTPQSVPASPAIQAIQARLPEALLPARSRCGYEPTQV